MGETENLIVGLGIAGLNLCHQLEKAGKSFIVIDNCPSNSASLIAGGIYNPVVFKRKLKSWKADLLIPALVQAYAEIDERLSISSLHHQFPILKPVSSNDDLAEWKQVIEEKRLAPYVRSIDETPLQPPFKKGYMASVTIQNGGFIRIENTLLAYRKYLLEKGLLVCENFDHSALKVTATSAEYQHIKADRVIFSEGWLISKNPFFNWVPFKPTKGQILTVRTDSALPPNRIYNQQFLLFPTDEEGVFKLGATYEWEQLDEISSNASTQELLEKTEKVLDVKFEVLEEKAAVRPTVSDRRPVVGVHPTHKNLFLFNGMGTKGVMIAPYFAQQLVENIYHQAEIDSEANLNRFIKRYRAGERKG